MNREFPTATRRSGAGKASWQSAPPPAIEAPPQDEWIDEGPVETSSRAASRHDDTTRRRVRRTRSQKAAHAKRAEELLAELKPIVGATRARTLSMRAADAVEELEAERLTAARRLLRPMVLEAPSSRTLQELVGLCEYRRGEWTSAIGHLEAAEALDGGSVEHHPVLADCERALENWVRVDELWNELRLASPSAELVVEGRIVAANALADRGEIDAAVRLLAKGWRVPAKPREHHLRRAYSLGDLYERAGDVAAARSTFGWLAGVEPGFGDAAERHDSLVGRRARRGARG